MPAKRSRLMGSASTGDAEFVTPPPASQDIWRQPRTPMIKPAEFSTSSTGKSKSADQARPPIFSITSTVYEQPFTGGESAGGIDNIFDKCYYCNKKIREDGDVFMYSDLRAFCTAECREKHICMEEGLIENAQAPKRAKDAFGPRPKRPNAP